VVAVLEDFGALIMNLTRYFGQADSLRQEEYILCELSLPPNTTFLS
jgi:hypothetical protein